jgi:hypothetical protein
VLRGASKSAAKDAKPDAVCDECTDDRKDKPVLGLEIIRGAKKAEGKDVWEGGKILDPENGRDYTLRLTRPSRAARSSKCAAPSGLLWPHPDLGPRRSNATTGTRFIEMSRFK